MNRAALVPITNGLLVNAAGRLLAGLSGLLSGYRRLLLRRLLIDLCKRLARLLKTLLALLLQNVLLHLLPDALRRSVNAADSKDQDVEGEDQGRQKCRFKRLRVRISCLLTAGFLRGGETFELGSNKLLIPDVSLYKIGFAAMELRLIL